MTFYGKNLLYCEKSTASHMAETSANGPLFGAFDK